MTNPSDAAPGDGEAVPNPKHRDGDDSDATPIGKHRVPPNDQQLVEKTIKFRFSSAAQRDNVPPERLHLHWIQTMQETYGKMIQIYNNKGAIMPKVDTLRWDIGQHKLHFNVHRQRFTTREFSRDIAGNKQPTVFIIHRIRTNITFSDIRSNPKVRELILNTGASISEHRWPEDVWNTTQLGFVLGIDPQFYNDAQAHERLTQALSRKLPSQTRLPRFKMAFCTPQTEFQGVKIRTKAYAVETEKQHSMEMMKLMKEACKDSHEFVPFYMRKKHPEAFRKTIVENTRIISENRTIMLHNISRDEMYYLRDRITHVNGVRDLIQCPSVDTDGKHKLLVHQKDFNRIRSSLMEQLQGWYDEHVAEDAKQSGKFPGAPQVAPISSDGYSSGEESYMATSVNTALSYTSNLSELTHITYDVEQSQISEVNSLPQAPQTWATKIKSSPNAQESQRNIQETIVDATFISDLKSSRAEAEEMRHKLATLEQEKESFKTELARQAEHHKKELDLQKEAQKLEIQRQADQQKRDFDKQLMEQRKELELHAQQQRQALEERLSQQIAQALNARKESPAPLPPPTPPTATTIQLPPEFYHMISNQERHLRHITTMLHNQRLAASTPPTTSHSTANKRAGSEVIDLTMDHHELENKKQDLKSTPDARTRTIPIGHVINIVDNIRMAQGYSPHSTTTATPDDIEERHPSSWEGFHSPSTFHSPQRSHHLNDHSPMSNLAMHPQFSSPGPSIGEDTIIAEKHYTEGSPQQTNALDDSQISDAHMADIITQHKHIGGTHSLTEEAIDHHGRDPSIASSSTPESTTREYQATPVDNLTGQQQHER